MRRLVYLLTLLVLALSIVSAETAAQDESDAPAVTAQLVELAETYPEDPDIAYALGVRYAHDGQLGLATLYLERAHLLAPLRRDTGDALHTVRQEARRRRAEDMPAQVIVEGEPPGVFWWRFFHVFGIRTYALGLLISVWGFFGLLAFWRRMPPGGRRDLLLVVTLGVGFVGLNAAAFWIGAGWTSRNHEPAVVVAESPRYVDAPDEISRPRRDANLYEGAIAVIIEDRGEWRLLQLVDGAQVWVRASVASPVLP